MVLHCTALYGPMPPWLPILALLSAVVLGGCTVSDPTPFEIGEETSPPYGCIEYRARGGEC